jgi:3-methyladenine DNA glycosylase/8-oxoguanine DNA glycosylase
VRANGPTPPVALEDQFAEIAQEVTLLGEAAERRRLDEIEAARQKRIRWKAAMEEARVQYAEAYRFRHFEAQEAAWRHATRLTEYLNAVRTRVETTPLAQTRTEAEIWISWAAAVERLAP